MVERTEMPRFNASEIDEAIQCVEEGKGPVLICGDDGKDMVLSRYDQYMERFGSLYTEEEIQAIEEACKNCRE